MGVRKLRPVQDDCTRLATFDLVVASLAIVDTIAILIVVGRPSYFAASALLGGAARSIQLVQKRLCFSKDILSL